jgi:dTDP-4-dehydrorhamnose reductase
MKTGGANKILLLGSTGRLGSEIMKLLVKPALKSSCRLVAPPSSILDLSDVSSVYKYLDATSPDLIINAAAATNVIDCETRKDIFKVNTDLVWTLSEYCKLENSKLLHISSNYLFPNCDHQIENYRIVRSDPHHKDGTFSATGSDPDLRHFRPYSKYGLSKALAEINITEKVGLNDELFRIVRVQNLFGGSGKNPSIPERILLGHETSSVVVSDIVIKPTHVAYTATAILSLFKFDNKMILWERDNVIEHVAPTCSTTERDFVRHVCSVFNINCKVTTISNPLRPSNVLLPTSIVPSFLEVSSDDFVSDELACGHRVGPKQSIGGIYERD